jgi:hypothetical protein
MTNLPKMIDPQDISVIDARRNDVPSFFCPYPERGEAKFIMVYRTDDDVINVRETRLDRWACTSLLASDTPDNIVGQIKLQCTDLIYRFAKALYKEFGAGRIEP